MGMTEKMEMIAWLRTFAMYYSLEKVGIALELFKDLFATATNLKAEQNILFSEHTSRIADQLTLDLKRFNIKNDIEIPDVFKDFGCFDKLYATQDQRNVFTLIVIELIAFNVFTAH